MLATLLNAREQTVVALLERLVTVSESLLCPSFSACLALA